jgi:hypothetical protein
MRLFAENPNFPGKLPRRNGLTQHLGGPHSPKNGNLISAIGRGLFRGMRVALLPSLGLWAPIIWLLAWRFWPF